jgi:hypothetical protein
MKRGILVKVAQVPHLGGSAADFIKNIVKKTFELVFGRNYGPRMPIGKRIN